MISTVVMFQAQKRETIEKDFKSCRVLQEHYGNERYKIVFHKTTPELQDQLKTAVCKTKTKTDLFGLRLVFS